jgi:outer membrane protein TolC
MFLKKLIAAIMAALFICHPFLSIAQDELSSEEEVTEDKDPFLEEILAEPVDLMGTAPLRLTLEECIRIALEHNAKLQATGYGIDAAKAQLSEASANGWPIFDYEYRTAPVPADAMHAVSSFFKGDMAWWNKIKIGLGMPVYSFGKISLAKEMARSGVYNAEVIAFQEKNQLVSKVRQLYYGVLLAEEVGRLLKEAHARLKEEIDKRDKKAEDENANGVANGGSEENYSPIDNMKMKVFLFDLEKRLAEARQKEALALEGLRVQMGLSVGTVFTVYSKKLRPVEADLKPVEDYTNVAMANRPDIKQLDTGLQVKKNQYLLEKAKLLPDLGFGGFFEIGRTVRKIRGLTATGDFEDPFNFTRVGFGVQLSGKFDVHGGLSRIRKSQSEYYKLNLEQMIAKEGVKFEIKDAFLRAKVAQGNLQRARNAEKTARQILFLAQSNYDIGVGEQRELVDALQLVLLTRGRYFEAVFDYNIALAQLDEKIGVIPEVKK